MEEAEAMRYEILVGIYPALIQAERNAAGNSPGKSHSARGQREVLVVSSQQETVKELAEILAPWGVDVAAASTMQGAFKLLVRRSYQLTVIDLDSCRLPPMEVKRRLGVSAPESYLGIIVGWWDRREREWEGFAELTLHRPLRPEQVWSALGLALDPRKEEEYDGANGEHDGSYGERVGIRHGLVDAVVRVRDPAVLGRALHSGRLGGRSVHPEERIPPAA